MMKLLGRGSAPAKLNLILRVTGRRPDGYHLLQMLNVCVDLCDSVELFQSEQSGDSIEISFADHHSDRISAEERRDICAPEQNSMTKAVAAFRKEFGIPYAVHITAQKNIPSGAGLGGGSSDAALVLRLLAEALIQPVERAASVERLQRIALSLGADVPFFLHGKAAWVGGVGEEVRPLANNPLSGREVLLVVPPYGCATPAVYAALRAQSPTILDTADQEQIPPERWTDGAALTEEFVGSLRNDLGQPACAVAPGLMPILGSLRELSGAYAQLTGSGSVVFALPLGHADFTPDLQEALASASRQHGCRLLWQKVL